MMRQKRIFVLIVMVAIGLIVRYNPPMMSKSLSQTEGKRGVNSEEHMSKELPSQTAHFVGKVHQDKDHLSLAYTERASSESNRANVSHVQKLTSSFDQAISEEQTTPEIPMKSTNVMGYLSKDIKKFAVISVSTDNRMSFGFSFYVPLTVLAWKRIGYGTILLIVGSKGDWLSNPHRSWVLSNALEKGAYCVFLPAANETQSLVSLVARTFAANIVNITAPHVQDSYLVISDADLWPLQRDAFDLPPGKVILSLNSECCGLFMHRGKQYKMLPSGHLCMSGRQWQKITYKNNITANTVEGIIKFVRMVYGNDTLLNVKKGKPGWYNDQKLVSMLIQDWGNDSANHQQIQYSPRNTAVDRIDRSRWSPKAVDGKIDAHLPVYDNPSRVWAKLEPLLSYMYGVNSTDIQWCARYCETFASFQKDN